MASNSVLWFLGATATLAAGCTQPMPVRPPAHGQERVEDFGALVPRAGTPRAHTAVRLERVTTAVPWPRGLAWVDGELVVLARGRHRRAGGIDTAIADRSGSLFAVDPHIVEPVQPGRAAGAAVRKNARLLTAPQQNPFLLYTGGEPRADTRMDRPYCTLIYDDASRNLFVCGYSGVDLPANVFRKNATDSIHRFDLRTQRWLPVELHDASIVPPAALGRVVANTYYPHHDPAQNAAPHGWLNGPNGGCVAGRYLYCTGKDNHSIARYDLEAVRRDPHAAPPPSQRVLGAEVLVRHPGGTRTMQALGPSAAVARDGWLYVGYRTSSVVLRFAIDDDGALRQPAIGELIAVFEPWRAARGRSANLIDLAFNHRGELFASCATDGRIWRIGIPDPATPFFGDDSGERPASAPPYIDLAAHVGHKTNCGNITFDAEDRLYLCSGNYDAGTDLAGVIYRVVEQSE